MNRSSQLPLDIHLRDDATFDNYLTNNKNTELVSMLDIQNKLPNIERFIYLYGSKGSGRSHLLQASCHQIKLANELSIYLPFKKLSQYTPSILDGIENLQLICIDDIHLISNHRQWEEALFNMFNRLKETKTRLLIAAECIPSQLSLTLPDLTSRLSSGVIFHVHQLTDEEKMQALQLRAHLRGLEFNEEITRFILHRSSRNMNQLFRVLQQLDRASLRDKRKITIPFIKQVMHW